MFSYYSIVLSSISLWTRVDEFWTWTDELRVAPSKRHCLCLGKRSTKYTSYDTGLFINGQKVTAVAKAVPLKFLVRKITKVAHDPYR